jgi:hypothetical protein
MDISNIFRYVICDGYVGGIIIANSLEEAMTKLKVYSDKHYCYFSEEERKPIVWKLEDSIQNDESGVFEIFK